MREEKRKAPRLRFPGFDGDWEQHKVSDVADIIAGGTPSTSIKSYWEPKEIPWLSSGEVNKKYISFTDNKISTEGMNHSSARMVKENSVLIALAGQGKTRGTVAINRIPLTTNQSIAAMIFTEDIVPEFVFCNLDSRYDEIRKMSSGDGARGGLNKQIVGDIIIPYTAKPEQTQIGCFFENIDNLIALHQCKLDQMKEYKKGMLQKMFPKKGETVPEVRFPGFEGDWEEKKLGQLFSFVKTKNTNGLIDNVITNSAEYGLIPQREYFDKDIAVEGHTDNYTIIEKGNFVYNPRKSTSAPYGPFNCYMLDERGVVSPLYTCLDLKNPEYAEYLIWYFKTDKWHPYIQNNGAQGGARHDRVGMTNELMKGIPILLPSVSEQKKIGEFFENLDSLITLQQHKINEMKEYKKGLLQQMFV